RTVLPYISTDARASAPIAPAPRLVTGAPWRRWLPRRSAASRRQAARSRFRARRRRFVILGQERERNGERARSSARARPRRRSLLRDLRRGRRSLLRGRGPRRPARLPPRSDLGGLAARLRRHD